MKIGVILLLLGAGWGAQLFLTTWQAKRFLRELARLRPLGAVYVGRGRVRTRRAHVALAIDERDAIRGARVLSGLTVFASAKDEPRLVGRSTADLSQGQGPRDLPAPVLAAAQHAAELYAQRPSSHKPLTAAEGSVARADQHRTADDAVRAAPNPGRSSTTTPERDG
jgi:DNA-binding transcriptional regulator of glucitol operon